MNDIFIHLELGGLMHLHDIGNLVIVLVGLPGRGKTYIGHKLCKYLSWLGYNSKVFSVSEYRRKNEQYLKLRGEFFDPKNENVYFGNYNKN